MLKIRNGLRKSFSVHLDRGASMGQLKSFRLKLLLLLIVTCSVVMGAGDVVAQGCNGPSLFVTSFTSVPASPSTITLDVAARPFGSFDCGYSEFPFGFLTRPGNSTLDHFNFRFEFGDGQTADWSMDATGHCEGPAGAFAACSISPPLSPGDVYRREGHIAAPFTYDIPGTYTATVIVTAVGSFDYIDTTGNIVGHSRLLLIGLDGATTNLTVPFVGPFTPAPVPEPETHAMMLAGLSLLGFLVRRRKNDLPQNRFQ